MLALLVGFLLVVASAGAFGFALFGQRPVPQPAIVGAGLQRDHAPSAENGPSGPDTTAASVSRAPHGAVTDTSGRTVRLSAADVRPSGARRLVAVGLLAISVVGSAVLIGAVLSIVTVGAILLIS